MIGDIDLTNSYEVEILYRSVAMLPAMSGQRLFTREEALRLLDALRAALRAVPLDSGLD